MGQTTSACGIRRLTSRLLQHAQAERGGLAAAGLGLRDQVAAFQDERQALRLDRCHLLETQALQVLQQGGQEGREEKEVSVTDKAARGNRAGLDRPTVYAFALSGCHRHYAEERRPDAEKQQPERAVHPGRASLAHQENLPHRGCGLSGRLASRPISTTRQTPPALSAPGAGARWMRWGETVVRGTLKGYQLRTSSSRPMPCIKL